MRIESSHFNSYIAGALHNARVPESQLRNVIRFPKVFRMFRMVTPNAMLIIEKDLPLLRSMNMNLSHICEISLSLTARINRSGLTIGHYKDDFGVNIFHTLRLLGELDKAVLRNMNESFVFGRTLEEVSLLFEAYGFTLKADGEWPEKSLISLLIYGFQRTLELSRGKHLQVIARLGDRLNSGILDGAVHITIPRSNVFSFWDGTRINPAT